MRLFIVHAPEDAWFVNGFLLGALNLPDDDVLVSSQLELGASIIEEIERGAVSPITVVVLSPAFSASPWAQFANQLAMHHSIEAAQDGTATLIPALLADCEVPLLSRFRVPLDFRDRRRERWAAEAAKLRARLAAPAQAIASLRCPYPGIRPFTSEDADDFHGRSQEVAELLGRLRDGQRELYVIGPSGCGKSSLVAAGLVPSLRRSPDLAGGVFLVRPLRPGADPIRALATALQATAAPGDAAVFWVGDAVGGLLGSHPGSARVLIFVDQLEELFTLAAATPRAAFCAALRALRGDARVALVMTLRADFYASLMESELWTDLGGQLSRVEVGPLRGDRLRRAIEQPARALGVAFEPVLVERLLHDVADEPGALPLLQDVLLELWHHRVGRLARLAEYEAMSDGVRTGLAVTVARRADGALCDLSPVQRSIARRVLVRLVQFGDGTMTTRRQQTRADLVTAGDAPEAIDAVVRHLADHRLITTSGGGEGLTPSSAIRVDLAHEVLLSAWPVLVEWIRTRKDDEQRRRALEAKADEWVSHGRGPSRLLDSDELREARDWLADDPANDLGVSEDLLALLARSEAALTAQRAEVEARRRRWRRWVTAALVVLTCAVVTVSLLALTAARRSREVKQQLARSYLSQGHAHLIANRPGKAALYLLAAREAGADDMALRMLFRWATQGMPVLRAVHDEGVTAAAMSPDGTRLVTASDHGSARIWNVVTGQLAAPPLVHHAQVLDVAWSADGTRIATAGADKTARVWSAMTGEPVTPPLAHDGSVERVAWSPDGTLVATFAGETARIWRAAGGMPATPGLVHTRCSICERSSILAMAWSPDSLRLATASEDGTVRVWDTRHGESVTPPLEHPGRVRAVLWAPDGTRVATVLPGNVFLWDAASGQLAVPPLDHSGWENAVDAVAWSPDGKRVAAASGDKDARVWDAVRGQPVTPLLRHDGIVNAVAWSPDGAQIATASQDGTARLWDVPGGQPAAPPLSHHDRVVAIAWSPTGARIATASMDGTARVWDATTGQVVAPWLVHQEGVTQVGWSPDGARVITTSFDSTVRVWPVASGQRPYRDMSELAWSPDGTRVATASSGNTARVWDGRSGQPATPPLGHQARVSMVAWSPDGTRVATASHDGTARVWDAVTGRAVTPPLPHQGDVQAVAWSPDGTRLATASKDRTARVWDAIAGTAVTPPLAHRDEVHAVAWSPDGTRLSTASDDGTARVWDATSGQPVAPPLVHQRAVHAVAWSPDGRRLATASDDRTARVWDPASGQPVASPLVHLTAVQVVVWSPDSERLATASEDKIARIWDTTSGRPVASPLAHDARVVAVAWSPDGTRVATASNDRTARVWDATSGQAITPPFAHAHEVIRVAWSPDGRRLATVSADDTARVWDVAWDTGTLADWRSLIERGEYRLDHNGVVVCEKRSTPRAPFLDYVYNAPRIRTDCP